MEELLKTYRARIAREGWINSLLCGLTVGFCLDIICSIVFLFLGIKLFWVGILAMVVATAIATPIFYFKKFKRSLRQVAARVDTLGLEERILTMAQFENDDSFMARRQREDAMSALKKVNDSLLRVAVSIPMIAICAATCILGAGATTATAVVDKGILATLEENKEEAEKNKFEVIYGVQNEEGGRVEGELVQKVTDGEASTPVEAIADEEYYFAGWSDGCEQPLRSDTVNGKGLAVYAIFLPVEENDEEDEQGSEKDGEDDGSQKGEGNPGDNNGSGIPSPGDNEGEGEGAGGSSLGPNSNVIDGSTSLGDVSGEATSEAQGDVSSNGDLGEGEIGMIGDYFGGIS